MKVALIASIGLSAASILVPAANAQQPTTTVTLVQKYQPVTRSYPGVSTDILGVRTGMTVSQAEAVAEKSYPGKPDEYKVPYFYDYKTVAAQSHPVVLKVTFTKQTAHVSDTLELYFSSPVTGNTLLGVDRTIKFGEDGNSALTAPLVSDLKASLLKKYGPTSYMNDKQYGGKVDATWGFTQTSLEFCNDYCGDELGAQNSNLTGAESDALGSMKFGCGDQESYYHFTFVITAEIEANYYDNTKADQVHVSMGDTATCIQDNKEAAKQLNAAAIKLYNTLSKSPTTKF